MLSPKLSGYFPRIFDSRILISRWRSPWLIFSSSSIAWLTLWLFSCWSCDVNVSRGISCSRHFLIEIFVWEDYLRFRFQEFGNICFGCFTNRSHALVGWTKDAGLRIYQTLAPREEIRIESLLRWPSGLEVLVCGGEGMAGEEKKYQARTAIYLDVFLGRFWLEGKEITWFNEKQALWNASALRSDWGLPDSVLTRAVKDPVGSRRIGKDSSESSVSKRSRVIVEHRSSEDFLVLSRYLKSQIWNL